MYSVNSDGENEDVVLGLYAVLGGDVLDLLFL